MLEAEGAYIGATLVSEEELPHVDPECFESPLWRDCRKSNITDLVLLLDRFPDHKAEILSAVDRGHPSRAGEYAAKIREAHKLRQAKKSAFGIGEAASVDEARAYAEDLLDATKPTSAPKPIFDELLDDLATDPDIYPSGFRMLDKLLGGFRPGQMVVVGGATSMGKTAYLLAMLSVMNRPAVFATAEMTRKEISERLMAILSGVSLQALRARNFSEADWRAMIDTAASWSMRQLKVQEISSPSEIEADTGDVIFVDYLQFLTTGEKNPYADVRAISKSLKSLATRKKSPVIVACQLSRAVDTRKDREPRLADLRDSGTISQDADIVLFPYRPGEYGRDEPSELIIAKNRHGPKGRTPLTWFAETARFAEATMSVVKALPSF